MVISLVDLIIITPELYEYTKDSSKIREPNCVDGCVYTIPNVNEYVHDCCEWSCGAFLSDSFPDLFKSVVIFTHY